MNSFEVVSRIFELLKEKGIPKMQFYRDCGVTAQAVHNWKVQKSCPSYQNIELISKYLGCGPGYLIDGFEQFKVFDDQSPLFSDSPKSLNTVGIDFGSACSFFDPNLPAETHDADTAEIMARIGTLTKRQKKIFLAQLRMLDEEDDDIENKKSRP